MGRRWIFQVEVAILAEALSFLIRKGFWLGLGLVLSFTQLCFTMLLGINFRLNSGGGTRLMRYISFLVFCYLFIYLFFWCCCEILAKLMEDYFRLINVKKEKFWILVSYNFVCFKVFRIGLLQFCLIHHWSFMVGYHQIQSVDQWVEALNNWL